MSCVSALSNSPRLPTALSILSANHAINLATKERVTAARMALVERRSESSDKPGGATQTRWKNLEDIPFFSSGALRTLWKVNWRLIKGRDMRNANQTPTVCHVARTLNVEDGTTAWNRDPC